MAKKDHLDTETSVSVELTPTSVKANAKSRFVAAVDRLAGSGVDWFSQKVEADTARARAVSDAEVAIIQAATKQAVASIRTDPEQAQRAIQGHLKKIIRYQVNKDAVVNHAAEDLSLNPPSESESTSGPDTLDEEFVERLERYAESATTEELRQKWGRVLASEIRTPGTFSGKVLRLIDELDPTLALLFERISGRRLGESLPLAIMGELKFSEAAGLINGGLLIDPGLGIHRTSQVVKLASGQEVHFIPMGKFAICIEVGSTIGSNDKVLIMADGAPVIPIQSMTPEGAAIATILPDLQEAAGRELLEKVRELAPKSYLYGRSDETDQFVRLAY